MRDTNIHRRLKSTCGLFQTEMLKWSLQGSRDLPKMTVRKSQGHPCLKTSAVPLTFVLLCWQAEWRTDKHETRNRGDGNKTGAQGHMGAFKGTVSKSIRISGIARTLKRRSQAVLVRRTYSLPMSTKQAQASEKQNHLDASSEPWKAFGSWLAKQITCWNSPTFPRYFLEAGNVSTHSWISTN